MGPFFEILVLSKYSSLCWMYRFLVEFLVEYKKILHLSFWGKRSGRDWKRRRLGLLPSLLVWWRFFFVFAGWWNLKCLRLWRDLRNRDRLKCRSALMVSTNSVVVHVVLEWPALESGSWSVSSSLWSVFSLFDFLMEGGFEKKKPALKNLEILLGCDLVAPRALARGEAPARQLLLGIKDEDGHWRQ